MNSLQGRGLDEYLLHQGNEIDATFYAEGCKEYKFKGWDDHKWDFMLDVYMKSRWWIFTRMN